MKTPLFTDEEKEYLRQFFRTKNALNRHMKAVAAIHAERWSETRRVNIMIAPLPFDFLKHSMFGKGGTAVKRRIRRERKQMRRRVSGGIAAR